MKKIFITLLLIAYSMLATAQSVNDCKQKLNKAADLFAQNNLQQSIKLFQQVYDSCKSFITENSYTDVVAYMSIIYAQLGNIEETISYGEQFVAIVEVNKNTSHYLYAKTYCNLGFAYYQQNKYQAALECFNIGMTLLAKQISDTSNTYIAYVLQYANCFYDVSNYYAALDINLKYIPICNTKYGKKSWQYVSAITGAGNAYAQLGIYDSSFYYHNESLSLRKQIFGTKHKEYAKGLSNIANVYSLQGKIADAIYYAEQEIKILKDAKEDNSLEYCVSLLNLGSYYREVGLLEKAVNYYIEYLQKIAVIKSRYSFQFINGIHKLTSLYLSTNEESLIKDAIGFLYESKYLLVKMKAEETIYYATTFSQLGKAYSKEIINKPDSAIYFINHSLSLIKKLGLANTEGYAINMSNLAKAYALQKKYDEAINVYREIVALYKKMYGDNFYKFSTIYNNMAIYYFYAGKYVQCDSFLNYSSQLEKEYLLKNTEGLTENEKDEYASSIKQSTFIAYDIRNAKKIKLKNDWLYNNILFYKGILLESSKGVLNSIRKSNNTVLKEKVNKYWQLKQWLGNQLLITKDKRSEKFDEIASEATLLERELMRSSEEFRNWKEQFNIQWKQLQSKLKQNEAAIEFVSYLLPVENSELNYYVAMIALPNVSEPILVPLFNEADFDKLVKKGNQESVVKKLYRSTITSNKTQPSDSLYHLIWKPLLPYLKNITTIYFSADGVINNLNLAAIITPQGKRLIEDYTFYQQSSTRNILKNQHNLSFSKIQFWGGIQYDDSKTTATTRSGTFNYLPGTLDEINNISTLITNKTGKKNIMLQSVNATEKNFKNLSGNSPEILHIATHGFFFAEKTASKNKFESAKNPMLRSGLALANANIYWSNTTATDEDEDGILAAYEIANMDLSNTKLVVLSACETGLGDIKSGEGVYGLQRAFKMAGVQYIIMSLWQVPDLETKEFMETFYTYCLQGKDIRTAFRATQIDMNKKYQPYQWAAFVLID